MLEQAVQEHIGSGSGDQWQYSPFEQAPQGFGPPGSIAPVSAISVSLVAAVESVDEGEPVDEDPDSEPVSVAPVDEDPDVGGEPVSVTA